MVCVVEYAVDKLGVRLERLREKKAMTQMQLAKASGIRQTTISAIELGKQQPRESTLRLLAVGLGIPFPELEAYLEGRKGLRIAHTLGEQPSSRRWVDRNPALFGRAVSALIALNEERVEEFIIGAEERPPG